MTTTIVPDATISGNDAISQEFPVCAQYLDIPWEAYPAGALVAIACSEEGKPITPKAGDHLLVHVEPFSSEPPTRWAIRMDGEVHDVHLWLRPAIDDLPEKLIVDPGGKAPMFSISQEQVIGRIIGVVGQSPITTDIETSTEPAHTPPPCETISEESNSDYLIKSPDEWLTIDQAIEHLKIREWLSMEVCGSPDTDGWKGSPAAITDLRNQLCSFQIYRDYIAREAGNPVDLRHKIALSDFQQHELKYSAMKGSDCVSYIRLGDKPITFPPGTSIVVLSQEDGLCVEAPSKETITFPNSLYGELIGEVVAYHLPTEKA